VARLEQLDLALMREAQADLVKPLQEPLPVARLDLKLKPPAIGVLHFARIEINAERKSRASLAFAHERLDRWLRKHDGQQAVLEAIAREDVGETRRDDTAKAVFHERPHRVLTRRPAAEIVICKEYLRTGIARLVQYKVRVRTPRFWHHTEDARIEKAPSIKEMCPETCTLDRLQKLLRNNLVGVNIGAL